MARLGILAGGGVLPRRIAEVAAARGDAPFIVAFPGQTDPKTVDGMDHAWIGIGAVGTTLDRLRDEDVRDVVMAGPMRRPSLSEMKPDFRAIVGLARAGKRALGDDGLLSAIIKEIEAEGFNVLGIQEILGGYLAPVGLIAGGTPDENALADIERGCAVLRALDPVDVGQAVVVQQGLVLAIEAIEGTDAMIARAGTLKRDAPAPILVKLAKSGQERRADLPTIGLETVRSAEQAGLRGIAVEAGAALVIDRDAMVAALDGTAFFVIGVEPSSDG